MERIIESGSTASIEIVNPTEEKISIAKRPYLQRGFIFEGEQDTTMHIESANSHMQSPRTTTLYFRYP